jgi:replication factor C subunit 1
MKPFDFVTADFGFRRPTTDQIRARIATIAFREGLKLPAPVLQAIIEGGNADIRQIINMISTIKIDKKDMDFEDGKKMTKAWEKHVILKPWDIVSKIMRPQMFSQSSSATLNDKTELYFNDHEFSYLMLQENYLKTQPSLLGGYDGKQRNLKYLELIEQASSSISDGDLVDRMIHGSQQQWSLMPLHAIFSFVKPASYMHGNFNTQVGFASWLGQNSKAGKLGRYVKEIQGHMRLRTSADRHEIRQQYMPALWNQTIGKMINEGKEAVDEVIDFMDSYYLTKEDYDAIMELGVGPMSMDESDGKSNPSSNVKKIDTQTKSAFTRTYNSRSHPMPFVKASAMAPGFTKSGAGGGAAKRDKPDLEEAIEDSEGEAGGDTKDDAAGDEEDDMDLSKDKYVKVPKKKAQGKKRKSAKNDDAEEDEEESEDEKPKKKAAKGKGKGKAKS